MTVTVEQAISHILDQKLHLSTETVPLSASIRRVLSTDIHSPISQPPFPRSPLDGYAVRSSDITTASKETPVRLNVRAKYYAGDPAFQEIRPGECARIMTGAMLPPGSDCVVKQELTDYGEDSVEIFASHEAWENYVFAGEDFKQGALVLKKDSVLDAASVAVAAAMGYTELPVYRKLKVAIISTGDELCELGEPLSPGKIYNSNLSYLLARLTELGCDCVYALHAKDDLISLCNAIRTAADKADLVLTTGGVSVGQKDLVPKALEEMHAYCVYHGIAMKPGMPTMLSVLNGTTVLSLSGNPFAAAVAFELIGKPFICANSHNSSLKTIRKTAKLNVSFEKESKGRRFIRAIYADGSITLPEGHSNGQLSSMIGCNCLIDVPSGEGTLTAGQTVEVIML